MRLQGRQLLRAEANRTVQVLGHAAVLLVHGLKGCIQNSGCTCHSTFITCGCPLPSMRGSRRYSWLVNR